MTLRVTKLDACDTLEWKDEIGDTVSDTTRIRLVYGMLFEACIAFFVFRQFWGQNSFKEGRM